MNMEINLQPLKLKIWLDFNMFNESFMYDFNMDVMELSNCGETMCHLNSFIYSVFCEIVDYIIIYTL